MGNATLSFNIAEKARLSHSSGRDMESTHFILSAKIQSRNWSKSTLRESKKYAKIFLWAQKWSWRLKIFGNEQKMNKNHLSYLQMENIHTLFYTMTIVVSESTTWLKHEYFDKTNNRLQSCLSIIWNYINSQN